MLSKKHRIPRKEFKPILESRIFLNSSHFSARLAPSLSIKVAVSVSKKVSKKAVIRNRTRRRSYSAIQQILPNLLPALYLIMAKPGAEKLKGELLQNELAELLKKR